MAETKKIYALKPAKRFIKIKFLFFSILIALLIFIQTIICLSSPFYLYLGVFLIPLSGILIFVFYNYFYKNPLQEEIRLEGSLLYYNNSSRIKQEKSAFELDPKKIKTILLHQALLDKLLNQKTISMKFLLKNNYIIKISHVLFNKKSLIFLKALFKKTDFEKKQLEIDPKLDSEYIKILTKLL